MTQCPFEADLADDGPKSRQNEMLQAAFGQQESSLLVVREEADTSGIGETGQRAWVCRLPTVSWMRRRPNTKY